MVESLKQKLVVYFSGTGGTERIADQYEMALRERKLPVFSHSLDLSDFEQIRNSYAEIVGASDRIILIYAVHAMDAPTPVYEWIAALPEGNKLPVAVISVSGGGEVWPNTSCRVRCIKALERKGYVVNYEKMMVMPSNISVATNDHLAMWLLRTLPDKVNRITTEILGGKRLRTRFKVSSRMLSFISIREKQNAYKFGKDLRVTAECTGCGWCAQHCPRNNIQLIDGKPMFADSCIICLRCVYGCPQHALATEHFKLLVNQNGFSLEELEQRMTGVELKPLKECSRGLFWMGIRRYLRG